MTSDEQKWLRAALDYDPDEAGSRLTNWEVDFIEDLDKRDNDYKLSDKQRACLQRIWEKLP